MPNSDVTKALLGNSLNASDVAGLRPEQIQALSGMQSQQQQAALGIVDTMRGREMQERQMALQEKQAEHSMQHNDRMFQLAQNTDFREGFKTELHGITTAITTRMAMDEEPMKARLLKAQTEGAELDIQQTKAAIAESQRVREVLTKYDDVQIPLAGTFNPDGSVASLSLMEAHAMGMADKLLLKNIEAEKMSPAPAEVQKFQYFRAMGVRDYNLNDHEATIFAMELDKAGQAVSRAEILKSIEGNHMLMMQFRNEPEAIGALVDALSNAVNSSTLLDSYRGKFRQDLAEDVRTATDPASGRSITRREQ